MRKTILTLLFILFICSHFFAQDRFRGKIIGTVTDINTSSPLPGVNIVIKGTYKGAATDLDGKYVINNVNPGQYDIEVSMIGYKIQLKTGVKVIAGETQTIDFELEESVLAFGQEVVVIGKKPLLQVDLTASEENFNADDISHKMRIVFHDDGIISQFEGYGKLKEFDWDLYRKKYGDIHRLDRILEAEGDTPNRYKISKQADVLMLFYLLSAEELSEIFERLGSYLQRIPGAGH